MNNFVELKSNSDYFQEYLYQSYECEKFSSKSWKKWSVWRGGICRKFLSDQLLKGGGIHSEYRRYPLSVDLQADINYMTHGC